MSELRSMYVTGQITEEMLNTIYSFAMKAREENRPFTHLLVSLPAFNKRLVLPGSHLEANFNEVCALFKETIILNTSITCKKNRDSIGFVESAINYQFNYGIGDEFIWSNISTMIYDFIKIIESDERITGKKEDELLTFFRILGKVIVEIALSGNILMASEPESHRGLPTVPLSQEQIANYMTKLKFFKGTEKFTIRWADSKNDFYRMVHDEGLSFLPDDNIVSSEYIKRYCNNFHYLTDEDIDYINNLPYKSPFRMGTVHDNIFHFCLRFTYIPPGCFTDLVHYFDVPTEVRTAIDFHIGDCVSDDFLTSLMIMHTKPEAQLIFQLPVEKATDEFLDKIVAFYAKKGHPITNYAMLCDKDVTNVASLMFYEENA